MKKQFIVGLILGFVSLLAVLLIMNTEVFKSLELKFFDYRYELRQRHIANPNIVITAIDDSSIEVLGRWPWSRKIHAELLNAFSRYPPKVIGFDILFAEEDEEGDVALDYYTKLLGNVVYAGYISGVDNKPVYPVVQLMGAGACGFINAPPDKDGIIRKIPLIIRSSGSVYPSFVLEVLCKYMDVDFKDVNVIFGKYVEIPHIGKVPIDENGSMWINYAGDQHVFREIAFQQVLNYQRMQDFANKMVLAGITATGIGDIGHIPIATNVPLITVHANALNTILNKDFFYKVPKAISIAVLFICVFFSCLVNSVFRPLKAGALSLFLVILCGVICIFLFQKNILADLLGPSLGIILPFLLITTYKYGWEEKEKRKIKKVFTHYLSRDVIDAILMEPEKLKLGGELKTATVLYIDLRNFSTFCEGKSPDEVVALLNQTFDWMTEIILRHGGLLDKYIGDAIMAIFGAPAEMPTDRQTEEAVRSAVEIVGKWRTMPADVRSRLDVGIGINTGQMLIGNMGSRYIFNYTAVGDEVNVAARIQGLTGEYKVNIIITDSVYNYVKDKFVINPLGSAAVKGRKAQVVIYDVKS